MVRILNILLKKVENLILRTKKNDDASNIHRSADFKALGLMIFSYKSIVDSTVANRHLQKWTTSFAIQRGLTKTSGDLMKSSPTFPCRNRGDRDISRFRMAVQCGSPISFWAPNYRFMNTLFGGQHTKLAGYKLNMKEKSWISSSNISLLWSHDVQVYSSNFWIPCSGGRGRLLKMEHFVNGWGPFLPKWVSRYLPMQDLAQTNPSRYPPCSSIA